MYSVVDHQRDLWKQGAEDLRDWLPLKTRHLLKPKVKPSLLSLQKATRRGLGEMIMLRRLVKDIDSEWRGHEDRHKVGI